MEKDHEKIFEGKIIYHWNIPADWKRYTENELIPDAYRVIENKHVKNGVIIYALYDGEWRANPLNSRTIVKHLIDINHYLIQELLKKKKLLHKVTVKPKKRSKIQSIKDWANKWRFRDHKNE